MRSMRVSLDQIQFSPPIFQRPECLLCCASGDMFASHKGASVLHVRADGEHRVLGKKPGLTDTEHFLPNGIALTMDGTLFIANILGDGGVWRIGTDGELVPHLMEADGTKLVAANFVMIDRAGRMWITCSTRSVDRSAPINQGVEDGFVVLIDRRGSRIVADSLAFTNECRLDKAGTALYVCETAGGRISRFPLSPSGELGARETFTQFARGTYPDGFAFDSEGYLWMAGPISNRVIRVAPDGKQELILEDVVPGHVDRVEAARAQGKFDREHFYMRSGRKVEALTSVAFGGPDLRTVYLGSLTNNRVASFRSGVPGETPVHWNVLGAI
jgi:sugar lactone lactonase YvrE